MDIDILPSGVSPHASSFTEEFISDVYLQADRARLEKSTVVGTTSQLKY
jgi:hypothetical protein